MGHVEGPGGIVQARAPSGSDGPADASDGIEIRGWRMASLEFSIRRMKSEQSAGDPQIVRMAFTLVNS